MSAQKEGLKVELKKRVKRLSSYGWPKGKVQMESSKKKNSKGR